MPRIVQLLRRYQTLLFLVALSLVGAIAVAQTLRLRYLEERHHRIFADFGQAQLEFQSRASQLAAEAERCRPEAGDSSESTRASGSSQPGTATGSPD